MNEVTPESVEATMAALAEPLRKQLRDVDLVIEGHIETLERYRKIRGDLWKALGAVDPNFVHPNANRNALKNGGKKKAEVSAETASQILADIRRNPNRWPEGFTATSLERDIPGRSQSTYAKALNVLHERGDIRLDHRGRGGANYWKLVA